MASVILQPGKEKPVRNRHPWVFSGAIARVDGQPQGGDLVDVIDASGQWQARGYYNARSQIVVRLLTWDQDEPAGHEWWRRQMAAAGARRDAIARSGETTAYRLVYAESDGLPGLIVDRYGDWLVMQFLTLGAEVRRDSLIAAATELFRPAGIVDRSDVPVRRQEGLVRAPALFSARRLRT